MLGQTIFMYTEYTSVLPLELTCKVSSVQVVNSLLANMFLFVNHHHHHHFTPENYNI